VPNDEIDELRVDARPEKRFFISMLVKDIELIPAIVDLVDNCVDGARSIRPEADFSGLWVDLRASPERFIITDNCGGIPTDVARQYAFRFGRPAEFEGIRGSVGQFGVGMKRALFKLGKWFEIESRTEHSYFLLRQDVDEWAAETDPDWTFRFIEVDDTYSLEGSAEAGTTITVEQLHQGVAADLDRAGTISRLRADLKLRHQDALQRGLRLVLNGESLAGGRPTLLLSEDFCPIKKHFPVNVNGDQVEVELAAGIVRGRDGDRDEGVAEDFQRPGDAGWYIFCNGRLLLAADRSRLTGWGTVAAAYHPQYRNFRGYAYVNAADSSLLPWNTTKTGVDEDSLVFRAVQQEMETALKRVQAVINRLKKERQDREPEERPLEAAVRAATEIPLDELPESETMRVPPLPPPVQGNRRRIAYLVNRGDFDRVAETLGVDSAPDVGRETFNYYLRTQVQ